MNNWAEFELSEAIKTNVESINQGYPHEEILYLDTGSITKGKIEQLQHLRMQEAPSRARRLAKHEDIVYSSVRPIQRHYGFIEHPSDNLVVSTGFVVITCKKNKVDPKFTYYYLTLDQIVEELDIIAEASTSTYPSLKPSDIEKLVVKFPVDVTEQRAIADVLTCLDDKIDLLHRQNKTLEAMGETLFRQWFVEDAQENWTDCSVSDFADHAKENVIPQNHADNLFSHYSIPSFDNERRPTLEPGREILSNKFKVLPYSILVSKLNPRTPRIWPICELSNDNSICSTEFQVIKPKSQDLFGFILFLLRSNEATDALIMAASGTSGSHQRVRPEDILNIGIKLPSETLAKKFSDLVMPNITKMQANLSQIQTLEKLRDTLLPKLLSGEVKVEI